MRSNSEKAIIFNRIIHFTYKYFLSFMYNIKIISASIRQGRKSHRVALFFKEYIENNFEANVEIIDLAALQFPLFEERLRFYDNPTPAMTDYARKIEMADGIIVVSPEYNGGYPASLKNAIDLLYAEWRNKPIAIAPVSDGQFGGSQVVQSLQLVFLKIGAWILPAQYPVPHVGKNYGENGEPLDKENIEKRAQRFLDTFFNHVSKFQTT